MTEAAELVDLRLRLAAQTNTPLRLVTVRRCGFTRSLWLKLEQHNPTGSIKYRTAAGLLAALDADFPLGPDTRIVESTSGNLGLALAQLATVVGSRFTAVVDPKLPPVLRDAIHAAGAEIVSVKQRDRYGGYLLTRLDTVRQLCRADVGLRWPDQYHNPANPAVHRDTVAAEIVRQTGGAIDAVFVAVSTGGTLAGVSEGLRIGAPAARVFAVDVQGSLVTSNRGGPHLLTGIGASRKSAFLRRNHYRRVLRVCDVDAVAYCRMLACDTGLTIGGSGGAVLAAALELSGGPTVPHCPVAVIPDGGENYRDTLYDDGWLADREVLDRVHAAQGRARAAGVSFELGAVARA